MKTFFAVFILLNSITFNSFSQDSYFINDSWENVIKFSTDRNQMLFVYIYSEKCDVCKELDEKVFSNTEKMNRLLEKVIFYKVDFNDKSNGQKIVEKFRLTKTPTFLFLRWNDNIYHKVEPITGDFDLESMYESIKIELENGIKRKAIINNYHQNKYDSKAIKEYLIQMATTYTNINLSSLLEQYLKSISAKEQETDETLKLMLKCSYYATNFSLEIHLRQLQKAVDEQNLYKQYLLKNRIISSLIERVSRGTVESKISIKKASEIAKKCNVITPNFYNNEDIIFDIYYNASARSSNKFMKLSKIYYDKNKELFNPLTLSRKDSIFYNQINNYIITDSLSTLSEKNILKSKKDYFSNAQAANLIFIAKNILIYEKYQNRIEFGIKCAKKAVELSPNATRLAIYGLLCDKNENYKNAYEALLEAIELENDKKDKIDSNISDYVFAAFLKIKNKIPEN
jgi:hypothetical protein